MRETPIHGPQTFSITKAFQQAVAFHHRSELQKAGELYQAILDIAPEHVDALHFLGVLRAQQGHPAAAIELISRAVRRQPNVADVHSNLGNAYQAAGRYPDALACYERALAIKPDHWDALNNRGTALQALDRHHEALASFERALAIKSDLASAHYNRGTALARLNRHAEAVTSFDAALTITPEYAEAHFARGNALQKLKRYEDALASYERALALRPGYISALINQSTVLGLLNRQEDSLASVGRALAFEPNNAEALNNRGIALSSLGRYEAAIADYDKALDIEPNFARAHNNRGDALRQCNRLHEALASFSRAQAIEPDYALAHFNESLVRLLGGEFALGWRKYEWRWTEFAEHQREFFAPLWHGSEAIAGRRILLHAEQGFGDTIQFVRYASLVAARGAHVVMEVQPELTRLMASVAGVTTVLRRGDALPAFDLQCPLLSLPLAFGTELATIPAQVPYLTVPVERIEQWRARLPSARALRVGLVWSGRPTHKNDHNRSLSLTTLAPLLSTERIQWVSLQRDVPGADKDILANAPDIMDLGGALVDFTDTAAVIALLDMVISVDTSVAHLAGALGKPVWVLLPFAPDWRWLLEREDSPWYPTARLYRQRQAGDWGGVIERVRADLATKASSQESPVPAPQAADASSAIQQAVALHQQGNLAAAERLYQSVLTEQPDHFDALHLLGVLRAQGGNRADAVKLLLRAVQLQPASADAQSNLGSVLGELGRHEEALEGYARALAIRPEHVDAHYNRGKAFQALGRYAEAIESYDRALAIRPNHAGALNNRGMIFTSLERLDESLHSFDRALQINPDDADALNNRGYALKELNRWDEALESYDRALKVRPDYADARFNRSLLLLLKGNFAQGWREYESRWSRKDAERRRHVGSVPWLGEGTIAGKRLLVWSEQGLGDTLQFCRYVSRLRSLGAAVMLEVQPSLKPLMQSLDGVANLIGQGEAVVEHDYQIPLLSLPQAFNTDLSSVPCQVPYLKAESGRVRRWRKLLGQDSKPKIGLVCSGSVGHKNDRNRSIALSLFDPLLRHDMELYLLQPEVRASDEPYLRTHPRIHDLRAELHDFGDTAALVECLDLVVSVDTSVVHLAGALGKPVWVLLPFAPDWRWLLEREDSPWYPTARLYRQRQAGDWGGVIERVRADLATKASSQEPSMPVIGVLPAHGGNRADGAKLLSGAVQLQPHSAAAHFKQGNALGRLGRYREAISSYDRALYIDPRHAEALSNRSNMLYRLGRYEEAIYGYEQALAIKPDYADALYNLGNALSKLGRYEDALESYDAALKAKPDYAEAFHNRGYTLKDLNRLDEALDSYDRALKIKPNNGEALSNRGITLLELKRLDEALESYDRALKVRPDYADARFNRSLLLLLKGNFAQGWREYESRWSRKDAERRRHVGSVPWLGEGTIAGKRLLVWSEQGLGDTLQFCRYVSRLRSLGAAVMLEVQPSLKPLMQSLDGVANLIGQGEAVVEHDYQIPLLSLPQAFNTDLSSVPCQVPYLKAESGRVRRWRKLLGQDSKPKIGLVCSGSVGHKNDRNRSIALSLFDPLLRHDMELYLLQPEVRASDEPYLRTHPRIHDLRAELHDFGDTAALVECLDLVVSVDTSVVHLAGALGKPVWVLLPFAPDWRWLLEREDSPWYPTARLYRQRQAGDWGGVIERVRADLATKASSQESPVPAPQAADASSAIQQAVALHQQGNLAAAERLYQSVLTEQPDHFDALHLLGVLRAQGGNRADAVKLLLRAVQLQPASADAQSNLGSVLGELGRHEEALEGYARALAIRPEHVDAHYNRGKAFQALGRYAEAIESYDRALAIRPNHAGALNNRGNTLQSLHRYEEAAATYDTLLMVNPDHKYVLGAAAHSRAHICDWRNFYLSERNLVEGVRSRRPVSSPLSFLGVSPVAADQLLCASTFTRDNFPSTPLTARNRGLCHQHPRIRVAYLSADFCDHPIAYLMAGLFEKHDRSKFEAIAISFAPAPGGKMRSRLVGSFDRFIDVENKGDDYVVELLRDLEVDIAVDLMGFTANARSGIFACRAAPVQVNYLGYPGTMGAEYMDYILADAFVIPQNHRVHYAEKVVCLPDCFQVNDSKRRISERTPTRAEMGLPEQGFVFCSFNNTYKLTPRVFDAWMRLLQKVNHSVIWLVQGDAPAADNLRREAAARDINPGRLVFSPRVPFEDYLARYRIADLFLDTFPFNAGTTASDALWAGLPVVTCAGEVFAARMAGSLLRAVGLPELVTHSLDAYESLALKLATDPTWLLSIKEKLVCNRLTTPLFDTDRFRRHIEAAYRTMWETCRRGEPPRSFAVDPNNF